MGPSVVATDLTFRYFAASRPVFSAFRVNIPGGSRCAILGPAGAGKTTLLEILSGAAASHYKTAIADGRVTIGDKTHIPIPHEVLFPRVGLVLQDPSVQISGIRHTVRSEIEFTLENLGMGKDVRAAKVAKILERFSLTHLADRHPYRLSGGEMQRVALASIVVAEPDLLLLDEPANALDERSRNELAGILRSLSPATTIVFTDYTPEFALETADRFVLLDNSTTRFEGTRDEFLTALSTFSALLPTEGIV